jgi:competence protein ComEC
MQKIARKVHQSWGVVMLCAGIVSGAVILNIFGISFFVSPLWLVFVGLIFGLMYFCPRIFLVALCVMAGMVLVLFRAANMGGSSGKTGTEILVTNARDWFSKRIENEIPEREAKLGMSYLLGMKTGLDKDLSENLRTVGLTHIVVASGAHLSILVEIARKIFGRISRFSGLLFSILFILFFMCMVGWTPSILRAGIMANLSLFCWYVGRKMKPWRMILTVMALTLLIDPTFIFNVAWLLSFASYSGIMMLGPGITKFFYGEKKPGFIASVVLTTIAATLMTLPITLYFFGQVSIISVLANLLILPTLSWAMGLVFLTGVFSGVPGISMVVSFLATKLLDFHILVVEFFGSMEQFLIKIEPYNPWVFMMYGIFGIIWLWQVRCERKS